MKKDYDLAIKSFMFITENEKAQWLWPEALIKLGLAYEGQNNIQKATESYRKAQGIQSPSAQKAERYLHLLNLQQKIKRQDAPK